MPIPANTPLELYLNVYQKVVWVDSRAPENRLKSLFNPNELQINTSVSIGNLHPVGWSQPVQQYAHTEAATFPISIPFSLRAYQDRGIPFPDFQQAQRFFRSFCYGESPGIAPSYLKMVWPKTAIVMSTVLSVDTDFQSWDSNMNLTRYAVNLSLAEVRADFLQKVDVLVGTSLMFPDGALAQVASNSTGKGLRLTAGSAVGRGGIRSR